MFSCVARAVSVDLSADTLIINRNVQASTKFRQRIVVRPRNFLTNHGFISIGETLPLGFALSGGIRTCRLRGDGAVLGRFGLVNFRVDVPFQVAVVKLHLREQLPCGIHPSELIDEAFDSRQVGCRNAS